MSHGNHRIDLERWLKIDGFEGYEVSNCGRVRSFRCYRHRLVRRAEPRVLAPSPNKRGYVVVDLNSDAGVRRCVPVHRLVALAFCPGRTAERDEVNHIDGDKANNAATNLEWVTRLENHRHALATGLRASVCRSVINEDTVREIRRLRRAGLTVPAIAEACGVNFYTARNVVNRRSWAHVAD